jgi:porin
MRIIGAALAAVLTTGTAAAQTTPAPPSPQTAPGPAETAKPAGEDGAPGPLAGNAETTLPRPADVPAAAGPLKSVGTGLADRGVYLRAILVDEFAGNVSGGQGRGTANSFATAFGGDLDLDRLAGWKGGAIHLTFNRSTGTSLAAVHTLNGVSFQTRYKTYQNTRLAILALDQDLFGGKVTLTAGRISALSYFNASPIYCNFQSNSVCFNPAVVPIGDRGLSFFPYGTWGGRVKVAPSKRVYFQVGAFEDNTALQPTDGFTFSTRQATGVQVAGELGFQSASPTAPHAFHLRLGGFVNTSPFNDPYLNAAGRPLAGNGGAPIRHDGLHSWYAMGDIVLHRPDPRSRRNLALFGGSIGVAEDYATWKSQTLAGLVYTGPFARRPADTAGIVVSYLRLGDQQLAALDAARRRAGGSDPSFRGEAIIEANYGVQLYRGVRLNPNLQYVIHPDNNLRPASARHSGNIVAFGLRLTVEAGDLLGFPLRR